MSFLIDKCSVFPLTEQIMNQCRRFSCGDKDLDNFFFQDAAKYEKQLLGKTRKRICRFALGKRIENKIDVF